MSQLRFIVVLVVALNIALVSWLLFKSPADPTASTGSLVDPLLEDNTMAASRYDLSDKAGELNIILISMDALRYDHTGIGGHSGGLTPNLDALAEESVVFHNATSAAPWTLPSHMAIWTGRWPSVHGVTNKLRPLSGGGWGDTTLSPGIETYPDHLVRAGWEAGGFTGGAGVSGRFGFGRGFSTYYDERAFAGMDTSMPPAIDWLETRPKEPFLLFLHGYDVHGQYPLPESEIGSIQYSGPLDGGIEEQARLREQGLSVIVEPGDPPDLTGELSSADADFLREIYALKIRNADQRLGTFISKLKAMGLYERSIIALISDHGDEFMEHGALDHGLSLYEEQLHVVMMLRVPGYGRRHDVREHVRTLDLFPTLLDTLGMPGPGGVDGTSLLPLLRGEAPESPVFSETDYRLFLNHRMIRDGDWKLVLDLQDGRKELYNLADDPLEKNDLSSAEPRRTYEMEQALRTWMAANRTNPEEFLGLDQAKIEIF